MGRDMPSRKPKTGGMNAPHFHALAFSRTRGGKMLAYEVGVTKARRAFNSQQAADAFLRRRYAEEGRECMVRRCYRRECAPRLD